MRKRYKQKRRSCALCKPQKRGWENRWKPKERQLLDSAETEVLEARSMQFRSHVHDNDVGAT